MLHYSSLSEWKHCSFFKLDHCDSCQRKKAHLRDENWVDEVVWSQVSGTRLPVSERRVEIAAVKDRLRRCLHLHPVRETPSAIKHTHYCASSLLCSFTIKLTKHAWCSLCKQQLGMTQKWTMLQHFALHAQVRSLTPWQRCYPNQWLCFSHLINITLKKLRL